MHQLEQTIIKAARGELQRLRAPSSTSEDRDDALAAFQALNALVMLAHIQDSGLSENAIKELLAIELEAAQAIRQLRGDKSSVDVKSGYQDEYHKAMRDPAYEAAMARMRSNFAPK